MKMRAASLATLALLFACSSDSDRYTLYRNSVMDAQARYHVASFDTSDGGKYNNENCNLAAELFLKQPGVTTRFWCEQGPFKK
jgi:hypothetical protein